MKTYHITLQGQDYTICLRSYSVEINGTRYKIRSLPARNLLFLTMEVDLPISGAHVMLVFGLWSMELVVDGVMLRTGKPYTPIGKIPVWAYVVSALNLAQIMNGAVGGVLAVLGIFLTLRLSTSENLAPALRVLLSIAYLVVSWAAVFALAFLLVSSGTIYY